MLSTARALLRTALADADLAPLTDVAVLLTTELCANAVQHAATGMELALTVDEAGLTVTVTDRGPVALELSAAGVPGLPNGSIGRYGLRMVAALASAWGTRHDDTGRHLVWFSISAPAPAQGPLPDPAPAESIPEPPTPEPAPTPAYWPSSRACRWLLHMPDSMTAQLDVRSLVTELLRRLCEVIGADEAGVSLDYGDGKGEHQLAQYGGAATRLPGPPPPEARPAGTPFPGLGRSQAVIEVRLAVDAPLRGRLRVHRRSRPGVDENPAAEELAALSADRIALAIESDWLRGADRRRRSWMTYLAETSELLAQSLDVNFTAALITQIVVPRLGEWCAVHLVDEHGAAAPATWGHADESALAPLRSWLDGEAGLGTGALWPRIEEALKDSRPVSFTTPVEGVTVPLTARGTILGTLTVGRPERGPHTAEDITLVSDVARRASLAIANAQLNATQVAISQAFQQALLPRTLPVSQRVEFAAEYLPAGTGTDIGGDFYDVLALPDDRWLVAVGDVCGKGASAAARTGRIRDVLRVLVRDGYRLERAIRLLNDAMDEPLDVQQFCTLAGAVLSDRQGAAGLDVELALAGHDQPLLLRADGSYRFLGEFGTAVGLLSEVRLTTTRHVLQRGDAMVIWTDGVTERRHGEEFFGRARLAELASKMAGASAAVMAAALRTAVRDFSPAPPQDDIALLVVKAR